MPAYSSVSRALRSLADQEAEVTRAVGRDPTKWGILRLDNVQQYIRQRDLRIGRENKMQIGVGATYFETEGFVEGADDLEDKRRRIAENKRKDLTLEMLMSWIDHKHLETVGVLHWMKVLTDYIPELAIYRSFISLLFRTRGAKHRVPLCKTKVHPLATSGKNEVVTVELKDALLDFFAQIGQTREDYLPRLLPVGGDGLTYEKILALQKYLQLHKDAFESFEIIKPVLEEWHAESTNLCQLHETHWGSPLSLDPSTLGHSARKIGRPEPTNKKKVDYYPGIQLVFLVLEVRMLDCWRSVSFIIIPIKY
jgi:hypothetical protein